MNLYYSWYTTKNQNKVFDHFWGLALKELTCREPYKAATKNTVSRWCKSLPKDSGINIDNYSSHLPSAAASPYAKSHGASISTIIRSTVWASKKTFGRFYNKK